MSSGGSRRRCSVCGERPRLTVKGFRGRPWKLCLNDDCPTMVEMRAKRAERQAQREAREAANNGAAGAKAAAAEPAEKAGAANGARGRAPRQEALARDRAHQAGRLRSADQPAGVFVTLEGIDRSGKTTQAALLAEALGAETVLLREPGGTDAGERIRDLLKDPAVELSARAELLLFCAARAELCARVVRPALDAGRDVVCDRFIDSTVAYQGVARGLGVETVEALNRVAIGDCIPELTVLLRIDPAAAGERGQQRLAAGETDGVDRFEGEGIESAAHRRRRLRASSPPTTRSGSWSSTPRVTPARCTSG